MDVSHSTDTRCFWVDPVAASLGVKFQVAEIHGVSPLLENPELEHVKGTAFEKAKGVDIKTSPVLLAYRQLLDSVGATSAVASPQFLIQLVHRNGRLPRINTVVDAYNVVSLRTLIVVSAHDLDKIEGNSRIQMTTGNEMFHPLGATSPVLLPANQWAGVVDNHILCQLNCKQSELSKVTTATRNLLIYVQGNSYTTDEQLRGALTEVCDEIVRFNGGNILYVDRCQQV